MAYTLCHAPLDTLVRRCVGSVTIATVEIPIVVLTPYQDDVSMTSPRHQYKLVLSIVRDM